MLNILHKLQCLGIIILLHRLNLQCNRHLCKQIRPQQQVL